MDEEANMGTQNSKGSTDGPWTWAFDPEVYVEAAGWVSVSLIFFSYGWWNNFFITFSRGLIRMSAYTHYMSDFITRIIHALNSC